MSREISSDEAYKARSALGDVTNHLWKRGFALVCTSDVKSGDENIQFAKKACQRVDKCVKENKNEEIAECVLRPHSYGANDSMKENIGDSASKILCESEKSCPLGVRQNAQLVQAFELDESGRDVIVEDERTDSDVIPQVASKEMVENNLVLDDVSVDNLDLSKDEYLDCSRFPESQESKCGFDSCIGQKGDGLSSVGIDMIKASSCSFCVKGD